MVWKRTNDKARQRSIVVHGADYTTAFIRNHNRLEEVRLPASVDLSKKSLKKIKDKQNFIYHPRITSKSK
jgi:hypothetical protein